MEFYPEVWKNIHNPEWLKYHSDEFRNEVIPALEKIFFAIPKPYQHLELSWHLDFREAETQIIKNKKCATNVIKLLKSSEIVIHRCMLISKVTF